MWLFLAFEGGEGGSEGTELSVRRGCCTFEGVSLIVLMLTNSLINLI